MKTKIIRIYLKTWKQIRQEFKGKREETIAEYIERFINQEKEEENGRRA